MANREGPFCGCGSRRIWQLAYERYLQSPDWQNRRQAVLRRALHLCEGCANRPALEIHHRVYPQGCLPGSHRWLAQEKLFDLVALCAGCHGDLHPGAQEQS
jgi:5-methylcytosine-specific restriction endonuclease McrA